jgi:CheY-like chemotaxis protein
MRFFERVKTPRSQEILKDYSSAFRIVPALGTQRMRDFAGNKSPTILVVDDSDDLRELLVTHLQNRGYKTVEAANGLEAIEQAHRTSPTLILMDINMPLLDGLTATRTIRQAQRLPDTAIVAFSAFLSGSNRQHALAAGCDDYVTKTEFVEELDGILKRFAPM